LIWVHPTKCSCLFLNNRWIIVFFNISSPWNFNCLIYFLNFSGVYSDELFDWIKFDFPMLIQHFLS
jgi:hypothetical protein